MIPQDLKPGDLLYSVFNGPLHVYRFVKYQNDKQTYVCHEIGDDRPHVTSIVYYKTPQEAYEAYLKEFDPAIEYLTQKIDELITYKTAMIDEKQRVIDILSAYTRKDTEVIKKLSGDML